MIYANKSQYSYILNKKPRNCKTLASQQKQGRITVNLIKN